MIYSDNVFGIKTEYHRRLCFLFFFLNIENTRFLFSEFVLFSVTSYDCIYIFRFYFAAY